METDYPESNRLPLGEKLRLAIEEELIHEFDRAKGTSPTELSNNHDGIACEIMSTVAGILVRTGEMCAERMGDMTLAQDLIGAEATDIKATVCSETYAYAPDPTCPPQTMQHRHTRGS